MQSTTRMAGSSDQIAAFWRMIREETRDRNRCSTADDRSGYSESQDVPKWIHSREG